MAGEKFIWKLEELTYVYTNMDLENDIYRIEIYSKDVYYLNIDPFVINLDKDDLIEDIVETEEETEAIEYEETQIIEEDIKEELIPVIIDVVNIVKVEKYIPIFSKYTKTLNNFVRLMDKYIDIKKKKDLSEDNENSLIIVRNAIVKVTEKLDKSTKDNRQEVLRELVDGVKELKKELKK